MNTTQSDERRGPGRPKKEETPRRRRNRGTVAVGRLGTNQDLLDFEKFAYRWINDDPGRIYTMTQNDEWDLIPNAPFT